MLDLSTFRRSVALGAAAALFLGCNTTLTLDNDRLQQVIEQGLQDQAQVAATVTCPDNQPLQQGNTFSCQAVTADGTTLIVQVTQTDSNGNVNWQVVGSQ